MNGFSVFGKSTMNGTLIDFPVNAFLFNLHLFIEGIKWIRSFLPYTKGRLFQILAFCVTSYSIGVDVYGFLVEVFECS